MSSPLPADDLRALLALQLVPGLGPMRTRGLLEHFGSAAAVLQASREQLEAIPGVGAKTATDIIDSLREVDVEAELARLEKYRTTVRAFGRPDYPASLAQISDAPMLLYVRGELRESDAKAVAIVGSRACTEYGKRIAARLAGELAQAGYVVVSGLARGIDGAAHRGALEGGGRTLAVLAGGLSRIYPPDHKKLAEEVEQNGALLSESSMAQEPMALLFPARNRIISGLSKAVVLVEAAEHSGALITARHAGEQGRIVLAVPGPVDHAASAGANALIRQGAVLCRGCDDVLEELEGVSNRIIAEKKAPVFPSGPPPGLVERELKVWEMLASGSRHLDELVRDTGIGVGTMSGLLLTLEMKRVVRRLPGNRYERNR